MLIRLKNKTVLIGIDGLWTFLLSNLVIITSIGLTFWPAFIYVTRLGRNCEHNTDSEALLVLGERLKNNLPGVNYIARLERASTIYKTGKVKYIFIVGGITGDAIISESACGKNYLLNKKIPASIIFTEDESLHTLENLQNIRKLLPDYNVDEISIITNRFHLARAGVLATGLRVNHVLCAAETDFKNSLKDWLIIIREAYFVHWYFTGKYWSTLTNSKTSLERIR